MGAVTAAALKEGLVEVIEDPFEVEVKKEKMELPLLCLSETGVEPLETASPEPCMLLLSRLLINPFTASASDM